MMASDPITAALNIGSSLIERLWPDPAQQADAKLKLLALQQSGELSLITAQSNIITAEAQSESWLAKSWRPILMLTFGALIVARWFGWAAPNLSEAEYLKLWDIVQLGLGGYVIGRSVEKTAPAIAEALSSSKGK
jgi:Holin of 3TMs, for gene-transfer release